MASDRVDITMTAVLRPKILKETLETILSRVVKKRGGFRLIINVDPIGEDVDPMKVIEIAKKRFSDVVYNIAEKPSFPKAVKWVWSKSDAPYVLHWEDDVNILHEVDIDDMIRILKKHENISSLRLYKKKIPNKKAFFTFQSHWRYNKDGFYIASRWQEQFGLNPILIKQEFVSEAVSRMVETINPEKQFRVSQKYMRPLIKKWKYGIYGKPGSPRMINGLKGQEWKNRMKLQKPRGTTFLEWEKR